MHIAVYYNRNNNNKKTTRKQNIRFDIVLNIQVFLMNVQMGFKMCIYELYTLNMLSRVKNAPLRECYTPKTFQT
jgi:hypothetical protein